MRYSIDHRERTYVKGYGFLFFTKNLRNKYDQWFFDQARKSGTEAGLPQNE